MINMKFMLRLFLHKRGCSLGQVHTGEAEDIRDVLLHWVAGIQAFLKFFKNSFRCSSLYCTYVAYHFV